MGCINQAFSDLTDGYAGKAAVLVFSEVCCVAILVGGTVNYFRQ